MKNEFGLHSILILSTMILFGCTSIPKLDTEKIRPWKPSLVNEYPGQTPVLAHYKKDGFELTYLAARHTNTIDSDTINLVNRLFDQFNFDVLLIESIPHSWGESPRWFVEEAKKNRTEKFIAGGESAFAAILADQKKIPFFAGEPHQQDVYNHLKSRGYTDEDIIGFYVVRQIPQWIREREIPEGLFQRKIPHFISSNCRLVSMKTCPNLARVLSWYKEKRGHELSVDVSNEETDPIRDGPLLTQKISADIGFIRDHFTLSIIEKLLHQYKSVAVIYGATHFITLRKSFDSALGNPTFVEDHP